MKIFTYEQDGQKITLVCDSRGTRNGFAHDCTFLLNGHGQSFDRYGQALGFFTECEANLRSDFLTEWNCSPFPRSATMRKKGFYTQLVRYEFDSLDDYDSDNWSDCEVRYYEEYVYEDWREEFEPA